MSSMSNVPVAVEVQLPDIIELIEPTGMVIVKLPVLPFLMPQVVLCLPASVPGRWRFLPVPGSRPTFTLCGRRNAIV